MKKNKSQINEIKNKTLLQCMNHHESFGENERTLYEPPQES